MALRIVESIFQFIFIICIPVFLISFSLAWGFNSRWIINYGFEKYDVSASTGLSNDNLKVISSSWIQYINSNREYWDIVIENDSNTFELFTENEQEHFKDVKALILLDYKVLFTTLVIMLLYIIFRTRLKTIEIYHKLAKNIFTGCIVTISLVFLLGIASFADFDTLFLNMHYLIFTNDFWYSEGYMLELFPGGFWYDAAFIIIGYLVITIVVAAILDFMFIRSIKARINMKINTVLLDDNRIDKQ
jgi:integral membrane protein (TIGR01906 family)